MAFYTIFLMTYQIGYVSTCHQHVTVLRKPVLSSFTFDLERKTYMERTYINN